MVLALVLVLAGCATPPPPPAKPVSYLVLLEEADGTTGRVLFTGAQGTVELSQAQQAVALQGPQTPYAVDPEVLRRDAQAAIAAQPLLPRTFVFYFDTSDARISRSSEALLVQVQEELQRRQAPDVSISGHTDTVGDAGRNAQLAQRRADYVARVLKPFLANALAVEISSHGESNLLVPTADGVAEPRNRRVEVVVR
jgi:outer membrane protein OmpA-like peptidoglycan-associated protein